jgi:hypothetical protein
MARRTKGTGSIFKRGNIWWITYVRNGVPVPESSRSQDKAEADRLLKQRLGEIAISKEVTPEKATINDLCGLVIADYRIRKLRDLKTVEWQYRAHIKRAIGSMLASRFGTKQARDYILSRRAEGAQDATLNRELAIIRRGFVLGRGEPINHSFRNSVGNRGYESSEQIVITVLLHTSQTPSSIARKDIPTRCRC